MFTIAAIGCGSPGDRLFAEAQRAMEDDRIENAARLFGDDGLGLDSIDVLEVVASVEKEFGVTIQSQEEGERVLESVDSLAAYLAENGQGG